eukprot:scaffold607764_cov15-Prasinocladus_malaysianus.AAC.1
MEGIEIDYGDVEVNARSVHHFQPKCDLLGSVHCRVRSADALRSDLALDVAKLIAQKATNAPQESRQPKPLASLKFNTSALVV